MLTTTNVGRKILDQVCTILIRWDKSNSTHQDRTRFSKAVFLIVKIRRKEASLLGLEHTRLSFLLRKKPTTILETILTVCLWVKSLRVSSPRPREESFGSTKVKHRTLDKHSPRTQDLANMSTRKRKTISKTKSSKRKLSMQLSTAVTLGQ